MGRRIDKTYEFARRHKSALLLLMFLGVAAPFSPPFFKMVAGTGFTFSTQTVYPGGSFTVSLPIVGPGAGSYPSSGQIPTFTLDQYGRVTAAGSADPLGSVNGQATLSSAYTFSTIAGAFEDVGLSYTLPSAGTYTVCYLARGRALASVAGAFITARLFNLSDSTVITDSEALLAYAPSAGVVTLSSATTCRHVTVAGSKVIKMQAAFTGSGTVSIKTVDSDSNGKTVMWYVKINYQ